MNTKRIKELAALTDGELARKLLIQEFGNDSETHWGNNAHDERVMVTINPDGIAQRTWEADHWVRLDEFDKDGFYAREIYEGKWVDEPLPKNVIARNVTIAAPKPIQQESKDTEILRAAQVLCKQLTGDDTFGWNPELLAQIADCTAACLPPTESALIFRAPILNPSALGKSRSSNISVRITPWSMVLTTKTRRISWQKTILVSF